VDWTALNHACVLLGGKLWVEPEEPITLGDPSSRGGYRRYDPFIALADLATVAAAVILHDRVLVVTTPFNRIAKRATAALRLPDGVIRELPTDLTGSGSTNPDAPQVDSLIDLGQVCRSGVAGSAGWS
jgi:hypothetical protein